MSRSRSPSAAPRLKQQQTFARVAAVLDDEVLPNLREQLALRTADLVDEDVNAALRALEAEFEQKQTKLEQETRAKQFRLDEELAGLREKEAKLEAASAALAAEKQALDEEKRLMAQGTGPEDVLVLNLGGEKLVSTRRGTLCAVEGSMMASAFSGRWDDSLTKDKDGNFFLDWDAALVTPLLGYLRCLRAVGGGFSAAPPVPVVDSGREPEFRTMLRHYGLEETIYPRKPPEVRDFCFVEPKIGGVRLSEQRRRVMRQGHFHWKRAFGTAVFDCPALEVPQTMLFRLEGLGSLEIGTGPLGPNIGVANMSVGSDDRSNLRTTAGLWTYRATDGQLLAPNAADILGPNPREPAKVGDVLSFSIFKDGRMALAINDVDLGVVFQNLPLTGFRPVVEMNSEPQQVMVLHKRDEEAVLPALPADV